MALTKFTTSTENVQGLATKPTESATQIKVIMDKGPTDLKTYLNDTLTAELEAITDSSSGADNIGATPIGISPNTVQGILEWLHTQISAVALSEIPDGAVTDAKLSPLAGDILARYAAHIILASTESTKAHVELATETETTTGTDNTRAVHPAGLKVELDKKIPLTQKAAASGVASLGADSVLVQKSSISGAFTGNGAASQFIDVGFVPSCVIVFLPIGGQYGNMSAMVATGATTFLISSYTALDIYSTGFRAYYNVSGGTLYDRVYFNESGKVMRYVAFK
jgi:hypothetical protein